jgi:1-acyl-sn-glycerol-3-phosphate acyltransferase
MKSIFLYLKFIMFLIFIIPKKVKLNNLKKQGRLQEAEEIAKDVLLDWASFTVKHSGITLNVKGRENIPDRNCLFVSNHQGLLDIPVIVSVINRQVGFVAKKELIKFKLISSWMKDIHSVFIDRDNVRDSIKTINEAVENLKSGYNMAIFPEGTRSRGPEVGEFKKGSMKLATKSQALVVPIAIDGTYKVLEANKWKVIPAKIDVIISKPIDVTSLTKEQQQDLSRMVENIIKNSLIENRNK